MTELSTQDDGKHQFQEPLSAQDQEVLIYPEDQIVRAAGMLQNLRASSNPAAQMQAYLDEFDHLLPALVELHIRQATEGNQPVLAQALRGLKSRVQTAPLRAPSGDCLQADTPPQSIGFHGKVILFTPTVTVGTGAGTAADAPFASQRMLHLREILEKAGCPVLGSTERPGFLESDPPDLAIFSNPHLDPAVLEQMALLSARKIPILLDLDRDFENLPVSHPDYANQGLGVQSRGRAYSASLLLANTITVPSKKMAETLQAASRCVYHAPEAWSKANTLWRLPLPARANLHIGLSGQFCQLEDIAIIRRIILRVMREFPHTRLVILDTPNIYHFFDHLDEDRRLFLPSLKVESRPALLKQVDILLIPLRNHPYNHAISDLALVEAGVAQIPWVASPAPAIIDWKEGGIIADSAEEWHSAIRELVLNENHRVMLAQAGALRAQHRELHEVSKIWSEIAVRTVEETVKKP